MPPKAAVKEPQAEKAKAPPPSDKKVKKPAAKSSPSPSPEKVKKGKKAPANEAMEESKVAGPSKK